jgi:hypothetical protein
MSVLQGPAVSRNWCPESTYRELVVPRSAVRFGHGAPVGLRAGSTTEQNPDRQVDELTERDAGGSGPIMVGAFGRRPQLDAVLEQLRPRDTVVVWRLDRLGRSLGHLIEVVTGLD